MGRPSLANERIAQILDAFETCIRKYGLKESSIPKIAEEAGIRHSMIRHYIGNRESLISAMVSRFTEHYIKILEDSISSRSEGSGLESSVDYFFSEIGGKGAENLIFSELIAASGRDLFIRDQLKGLYKRICEMITLAFLREFPEAEVFLVRSMSYSLLSMWLGHSILFHLDFGEEGIQMASSAAKKIISDMASPYRLSEVSN